MAIVTGDQYLDSLVKFVENQAERLIEGTAVMKLNPVGLRYVQSRLEALEELERLIAAAPVDYLRAYVSDLGDHRALEQLRRILRLLPALKVVSVLPPPGRDPTPLYLVPFGRVKVLELRGCDLSTSAARGLLELRFTLEKLICHNSTDALRHVFASRIAEIKDSPQWNRLSFVSGACNGLVLMDESLQLLPAVETLDLSRNKFAKVDNLWKCNKLKHLDLGFNALRSIASFAKVFCQIVNLDLRNNALSALHGIENLKSLEGLDLSFNVISNFSEVEILAGLPSLQNLWLEGNPLCCATWYRAQVFSLFSHPEILKLDEKRISSSEFWKQQIIVASRQKQPASFGFYSPAKDNAYLEGIHAKKKRIYRVASIESEEQITHLCSNQDSASPDNEVEIKGEESITDEEAEIEDMMKRIELMKKERSVLWLQEFKEWMDQASVSDVNGGRLRNKTSSTNKVIHLNSNTDNENFGEASKNISDSIQNSENDRIIAKNLSSNKEESRFLNNEGDNVRGKNVISSSTAIDDIIGSRSSSCCPRSPPHYQQDILSRRHNLEEEFLQLSAESFSVASSNSNTSCSEDEYDEFGPFDGLSEISDAYLEKDSSVKQNGTLTSRRPTKENINSTECRECRSDMESDGKEIFRVSDQLKSFPVSNNRDYTLSDGTNAFIESYFNLNIADSGVSEVFTQCVQCSYVVPLKSGYCERDVAVLRSSKQKLYILLIIDTRDGPGTSLEMIGCHMVNDVKEVFVGIGLQILRVSFEGNATYIFTTRCIERSRELLCVLDSFDSSGMKDHFSLTSLEHIQINLFEERICKGSKINLFQYAMVLFWQNNLQDDLWLPRSLFVLERHLILCTEDLFQFGPTENSFTHDYLALDSCCSIASVSEMVIETSDNLYVTLFFKCTPELHSSEKGYRIENSFLNKESACDHLIWKLQWFSKESLFKFEALLKATHAQSTSSPLVVTYHPPMK